MTQFSRIRDPYFLVSTVLLAILLAACSNAQPTAGPLTPSPVTPPAVTTAAPPVSTVTGPVRVNTPSPSGGSGPVSIALLLATDDDRSKQVRDVFVQAATNPTTTVAVSIAGGDAAKQKAQVNDALDKGAPVLVIQPVDQDAAGAFVDAAHKAGSQVIALDRLVNTRDLDAYVSYDYFKAGQLQASDAVRWLTAAKAKSPWNFVLLEGPAGDAVSAEITRGYYDVLKSLIDKKQVVITADQAHPDGTSDQARKTVVDALTKTNNNVMAVLANTSSLASGALAALDTQKLTGKVYVAGAGADMENVRAVCAGSQNLAVLEDIKPLATGAARLAVAMAHGVSVADTNVAQSNLTVADKPVPMLRVPVQPLALDTIQANLVQTGLVAADQVGKCAPPLPEGVSIPTAGVQGQLNLWMREDPDVYNYYANLAAGFANANPGASIRLTNMDANALQTKFQSSALSSDSPDLLLTTGDQGVTFVGSDLLQPVDDWIDPTQFLTVTLGALTVNDRRYGVPIQPANYLVLYYNKKLIKEPPADTAALLRLAGSLTRSDAQQWTLLWNQTEPQYLIPWLGGNKGRVFADDGRTPTFMTQAMTDTLTMLKDFRDKKVIAPDSDGEMTDTGFRLGKAAMVINGDWALKDYQATLGDNLGVARIPQVTKTREYPHPYASGRYLMAPRRLSGDRLTIARAFARFITSRPIQVEMAKKFDRLPALREAVADTSITSDPQLKGLADQISAAIAQPPRNLQCIWDAITPNVGPAVAGKSTPADAAKAMQDKASACSP